MIIQLKTHFETHLYLIVICYHGNIGGGAQIWPRVIVVISITIKSVCGYRPLAPTVYRQFFDVWHDCFFPSQKTTLLQPDVYDRLWCLMLHQGENHWMVLFLTFLVLGDRKRASSLLFCCCQTDISTRIPWTPSRYIYHLGMLVDIIIIIIIKIICLIICTYIYYIFKVMSQDVTSAVNTGSISQSSAAVTIGSTYPPLMSQQTGLRYLIIYYFTRW